MSTSDPQNQSFLFDLISNPTKQPGASHLDEDDALCTLENKCHAAAPVVEDASTLFRTNRKKDARPGEQQHDNSHEEMNAPFLLLTSIKKQNLPVKKDYFETLNSTLNDPMEPSI